MSVTVAIGSAGRPPSASRSSAARSAKTTASRRAAIRGLLRDYHRSGDLGARARVIQQYLPLVRRLARKYVGYGEQFDDLVQVGSIGLIKAVDRFRLERDVDLASYAIPTIDGEIRRHLRDRTWPVRIPRRLQELDPTLRARVAEVVDGQNGEFDVQPTFDPGYELGEDRIALASGFRVLDERERLILRLSYFEGLSQAQIAPRLGVSQIHVSRLARRALAKLRDEIGEDES